MKVPTRITAGVKVRPVRASISTPAPTIWAIRYTLTTASVPTAATIRVGRSRIRYASTSTAVYLPELRIRSPMKSSRGRKATMAAIRPTIPSKPNRKIRPAKPRNDDADM